MTPIQKLRHHVTGAIERGEAVAIVEVDNLCEVTEERMIAAHQAGMAYWKHNRTFLGRDQAISVARSTGWHGELQQCWTAGFFGAAKRA